MGCWGNFPMQATSSLLPSAKYAMLIPGVSGELALTVRQETLLANAQKPLTLSLMYSSLGAVDIAGYHKTVGKLQEQSTITARNSLKGGNLKLIFFFPQGCELLQKHIWERHLCHILSIKQLIFCTLVIPSSPFCTFAALI